MPKTPMRDLRDVLLDAIGLDNSQCDLPLEALIQKVAAEQRIWLSDGAAATGSLGRV